MRIQVIKIMRIHSDPDPQYSFQDWHIPPTWMVSRLCVIWSPLPASCCSLFQPVSSPSSTCCCSSFTPLKIRPFFQQLKILLYQIRTS